MWPRRTSSRNFRGSVGGRCRRRFLREQRRSMVRRRFLIPFLDGERGMGKGEWCVWGSCAQLPKESNEESNDALGQRELGLAAAVAQKIQVPGDFKLAVKLRRGAKGNAETTNELKRRAESVSFNHIGGDRYRCSTDLVGEGEETTEGGSGGEAGGRTRPRLLAIPGPQRRQMLHCAHIVV